MTLQVFTARISSRDPDALNITRKSAKPEGIAFAPSWPLLMRGKRGEVTSEEYARLYTAEMRESYKRHRARWDALLKRERVVCVCYCTQHEHCHRTVFARDILPKLGAVYCGEWIDVDALMRVVASDACQRAVPRSLLDGGNRNESCGYVRDEASESALRTLLDALDRFVAGRARRCA